MIEPGAKNEPYCVSSIKVVLSDREAVRKRPGMYFGDIGHLAAVKHVIDELVSNSIDEFLDGKATEVQVTLNGNQITVADDGAGLPFDLMTEDGSENLATHRLLNPHFGRSVDDHAPHIHLHGPRGLGLAVVNFVSAVFKCQSWRDGKLWQQEFADGIARGPARIVGEGEGRGTTIALTVDSGILGADRPCFAELRAHLFQAVHLFPGLVVRLQNEVFHAPHGLADFAYIAVKQTTIGQFYWSDKPVFHLQTRHQNMTIQAAALGIAEEDGEDSIWYSWVNGSLTVQHGTHCDGFNDALRQLKWKPAVALLHVVMHDPKYAGPVRDRLVVKAARKTVCEGVYPALAEFCEEYLTE